MKKLLFIVNVDKGLISHRLPIALAALKKGYEVHIACGITDKQEWIENKGIIVHPISLSRSGVGIWGELIAIRQLFSVIREVKPHIIHSVTIKPVLYGNIIGRLLRTPVRVSSISGLGYVFIAEGLKAKLLRFIISILYKMALPKSQFVIFQNKDDQDILKKMGAIKNDQVILIRGSGIDLKTHKMQPEPKGTPVVMLLARLLIDKGVNEFVEAARVLDGKNIKVRMVLVGDIDEGNPKSVSQLEIKKWLEEGVIEHWGYSECVSNTIAKSNIMVLPSYREGLPKSLIEAAASGRAVITTNVPGCRDAIEPNKTGLLVPVKSVTSLVEAILKLIDDESLRFKFAENGRKLAESAFNIDDVVAKHLEIYESQ